MNYCHQTKYCVQAHVSHIFRSATAFMIHKFWVWASQDYLYMQYTPTPVILYGAVLSCSHIEPVTVLKMTQHDKTNKISVRPLKTQISLGICPVWSESWHCAPWVAKDPSFFHADSKDWSVWADAQVDLSLPWAHTHFVGFVMLWFNYWSGVWQNQQDDECTKQRLKSARASTQSDHSSLCSQWVAKDPMLLHADSEDWSDWVDAQANLCLWWAHRSFCGFCHVVTQLLKIASFLNTGNKLHVMWI